MAVIVLIRHKESVIIKDDSLFRGELSIVLLHLLFTILTFGLWLLIVCFIYNKQYMIGIAYNG